MTGDQDRVAGVQGGALSYGSKNVSHFEVTFGATMFSRTYHSQGTDATGTGPPIHIATSPDEKQSYVANRESGDISAFDISSVDGSPSIVSGSPFLLGTDTNPFAAAVHPAGKRLYVAGKDAVTVFNITSSTGRSFGLRLVNCSPLSPRSEDAFLIAREIHSFSRRRSAVLDAALLLRFLQRAFHSPRAP